MNDKSPAAPLLPEDIIIPVIAEQLNISKEWLETSKLQVAKTVSQQEVPYSLSLAEEELVTERTALNQMVETAPPAVRQEGDTTIISVIKEVLVVEKRLMLVEEIRITKRTKENVVSGTETIKVEQVNITRLDNTPDSQA